MARAVEVDRSEKNWKQRVECAVRISKKINSIFYKNDILLIKFNSFFFLIKCKNHRFFIIIIRPDENTYE